MLRIESALCQYGIREAAEALERSTAASSLSERKRGQILRSSTEFLAHEPHDSGRNHTASISGYEDARQALIAGRVASFSATPASIM
jgi:hypothetical protein